MYDAADSCKAAARMAAPARALLLRPADDDRGDPIPERLPSRVSISLRPPAVSSAISAPAQHS